LSGEPEAPPARGVALAKPVAFVDRYRSCLSAAEVAGIPLISEVRIGACCQGVRTSESGHLSVMTILRIVIPLWPVGDDLSENRYPPRIKSGAGFFGIML
jgi:hypothetical protein